MFPCSVYYLKPFRVNFRTVKTNMSLQNTDLIKIMQNFWLFLLYIKYQYWIQCHHFYMYHNLFCTTYSQVSTLNLVEHFSFKSFSHLFGSSVQSFRKSSVHFPVTINQRLRDSGSTWHATPGVWQDTVWDSVCSSWNKTNK